MNLVPLKDVCEVFGDGDWIESKDQSDGGIRLIQTGNIGVGIFKDRIEKARWISEDTFKRLRCTEILEGDVLISRLPEPVGRSCLIPALDQKAITAVDCTILRFDQNKIKAKFFIYYSQSSQYSKTIEPLITGSTRQRISREKLGSVRIPLPDLETQRDIVEKLDNAFTELDLLDENLQLIDGKANELLQSLQSKVLTGIESECEEIRLGDLGKWITGSTPSTTNKEFWGNEVPFVTPADLGASGELGKIGRQISKLGSEQVRVVTAPSVLLVCIGATLGKVAWTNHTITTNQQITALQVDAKKVNTKFAMYLLSSPSLQKKLWDSSTGTTVPILNKKNLESIVVSLPSLKKQNEIVEKLDTLFIQIELLKRQFAFERDKVSTLRQSLLSSVFIQEEAVA